MLGYVVQTEDTLTDMDNWKCPKAMKGKRIDMTWIYPDRNEYAIALEHQGSNSLEKITVDIKKLCLILGLKVLVVYRQNTLQIQKIAAREIPKIDGQEGSFLLINIPDYFRDKPPIKRLEARLIGENGKFVAAGTAEARKESITGLRFFSNIKWHHPKT